MHTKESTNGWQLAHGALIAAGSSVLVIGAIALSLAEGKGSQKPLPTPQKPTPNLEGAIAITPGVLSAAADNTPTPETLPTGDHVTFNGTDWSCRTIGSGTPNAYRAALQAGDPDVVEPGPYLHIDAAGLPNIVQQLSDIRLVHNNERVCVAVKPQSRAPEKKSIANVMQRQGVVFERTVRMRNNAAGGLFKRG